MTIAIPRGVMPDDFTLKTLALATSTLMGTDRSPA
jgi:hypothetical protein